MLRESPFMRGFSRGFGNLRGYDGGAPPAGSIYPIDYNFADSACYPGSGQSITNLGTEGTAGDLWLGQTSSASTDDPTYTSSEYFSFDGGDVLKAINSLPTFMRDCAKDSSPIYFCVKFRTPVTTGNTNRPLFSIGRMSGTSPIGLTLYQYGTGFRFQRRRSASGALTATFGSGVGTTNDHIVTGCCEWGPSNRGYKLKLDGGSIATGSLDTTSDTSTANDQFFIGGFDNNPLQFAVSGMRVYDVVIGNGWLSDTDLDALYAEVSGR